MKRAGIFRVGAAIGVGVVAGLGLAGCASEGNLKIFAEEQTAEDILPDTGSWGDTFDVDTSRYLWANDDVTYFAVLSQEGRPCLVIMDPDAGAAGCSTTLPVEVSNGGPNMMLGDNLPDSSDRWEKVADHLWMEK